MFGNTRHLRCFEKAICTYTEAWDYLKESEPLLKIWSSSLILRSVSISPPLTNPHIPYKGVFQINSSNYSCIRPREHLDIESLLENHLRMNTCWRMNKAELGRKFNVDAVPTKESSELTVSARLKMAKQNCPKMRKQGWVDYSLDWCYPWEGDMPWARWLTSDEENAGGG